MESMLITEVLFPKDAILTFKSAGITFPFSIQEKVTGESPRERVHWMEVLSDTEDGSSPKLNGLIFGKTSGNLKILMIFDSHI